MAKDRSPRPSRVAIGVQGDLDVVGPVAIEGKVDVVGSVEVKEDVTIAGTPPIPGNENSGSS